MTLEARLRRAEAALEAQLPAEPLTLRFSIIGDECEPHVVGDARSGLVVEYVKLGEDPDGPDDATRAH